MPTGTEHRAICLLGLLGIACAALAQAQPSTPRSMLDALSGFDAGRIEGVARWVTEPDEAGGLAEAAKLLYQVNRAAASIAALRPPAQDAVLPELDRDTLTLGDRVAIRGRVTELEGVALPGELADILEFAQVYRTTVEVGEQIVVVLTSGVPRAWLAVDDPPGDETTAASGVLVRAPSEDHPTVIAAAGLAWYPAADLADEQGLGLLVQHGFDAALVDTIGQLDRQPLVAADATAFFAMLNAAAAVGAAGELADPPPLDVGQLLQAPDQAIAQGLRLACQSVRVTRVAVTSTAQRELLGADHYWQIDCLGDLGDTVVRIEATDDQSDAVTFQHRYPVSIVALRLPEFLQTLVASSDGVVQTDVLMLSRQLSVDGFFYRLWSYESDLMRQHGGGDQFGPLLMAARIRDAEPAGGDVVGVRVIGALAAAAIILMLLAAVVWIRQTARQDAAAKARRAELPERLEPPDASHPW